MCVDICDTHFYRYNMDICYLKCQIKYTENRAKPIPLFQKTKQDPYISKLLAFNSCHWNCANLL